MPGASADIDRLVEERRAWSPDAVRAELAALEPLPDQGDPGWGGDDTVGRAELLAAHLELLTASAAGVESIEVALSKLGIGDPGGRLRGPMSRLVAACAPDERVALLARELRVGPPGARWWAAHALGRLADPDTVPLLFSRLSDPVPAVGDAVCDALLLVATTDPEVRVPLRETLTEIISGGGPLVAAAARTRVALDALERGAGS